MGTVSLASTDLVNKLFLWEKYWPPWWFSCSGYLAAQGFPGSRKDGKYYTVNGVKIWTVSFGRGAPLFIIAGAPGGSHIGLRGSDSLSNNHTLVYYDGFGRGKSDTAADVKAYNLQ